LARLTMASGFRAVVTAVDSLQLDRSFTGRDFDGAFLRELPESVDPCGERGEFHTFVHAGPLLQRPVRFKRGEVFLWNGRFWGQDLLPADDAEPEADVRDQGLD